MRYRWLSCLFSRCDFGGNCILIFQLEREGGGKLLVSGKERKKKQRIADLFVLEVLYEDDFFNMGNIR